MKTLEDIYNEVLASEDLTAEYKSLQTAEEQAAFVKKLGGNAAAEEIADFLDRQNNKFGALTDAELEQVVGGKGSVSGATCPYCGSGDTVSRADSSGYTAFFCNNCNRRWYG